MTSAAGIVLCGGRSSRMGRAKAWLPFGNELLLQRTVRILREVVDPIVVVAAPDQDVPKLPDDIHVARDDRGFLGPLNGLAVGLASLQNRADVAYLSSCDVPFLQPSFIGRVIERMDDADICIPEASGFRHPLAAVYRINLLPVVRSMIAAGRMRPVFLTEMRPTQVLHEVDFADVDPALQSLRNVNTPDEYEQALRDAGQGALWTRMTAVRCWKNRPIAFIEQHRNRQRSNWNDWPDLRKRSVGRTLDGRTVAKQISALPRSIRKCRLQSTPRELRRARPGTTPGSFRATSQTIAMRESRRTPAPPGTGPDSPNVRAAIPPSAVPRRRPRDSRKPARSRRER